MNEQDRKEIINSVEAIITREFQCLKDLMIKNQETLFNKWYKLEKMEKEKEEQEKRKCIEFTNNDLAEYKEYKENQFEQVKQYDIDDTLILALDVKNKSMWYYEWIGYICTSSCDFDDFVMVFDKHLKKYSKVKDEQKDLQTKQYSIDDTLVLALDVKNKSMWYYEWVGDSCTSSCDFDDIIKVFDRHLEEHSKVKKDKSSESSLIPDKKEFVVHKCSWKYCKQTEQDYLLTKEYPILCYIYEANEKFLPDETPCWLYDVLNEIEKESGGSYTEHQESVFGMNKKFYEVLIKHIGCINSKPINDKKEIEEIDE